MEPLKLVIFYLMQRHLQRHFADLVISVAFCNIYFIRKAFNGFLVPNDTRTSLKDVWVYNVRKLHLPRMSDGFLADRSIRL